MTNEKTATAKDGTSSGAGPSPGRKTTKSFMSDERERRFLDALEDDEVREVLRGFHRLAGHPSAKKTLMK